jgi:thioredoxin reductase (NADPH)
MNKEIYLKCSKEKKIEFDKYELSHRKFVEACKKGIPDDTYIKVNDNYETDINGIYAVGDIIDKQVYQISTAIADGTIAAVNIIEKCK